MPVMVVKQKFSLAKFMFYWIPVLIWMGCIFLASSIPGSNIPSLFSHQDIVFHAGVYAVLGILFKRALKNQFSSIGATKLIVFTVLFGLIYGFTDEFHQYFVPYRNADIFDLFIDVVGTLLGSIVLR